MRAFSAVLAVAMVVFIAAGCGAKREELPQLGPEEIQPAPAPAAARPAVMLETPAPDRAAALARPVGTDRVGPALPGPAGTQVYTVKKGDTLYGIAREFYGDARLRTRIVDANKDKIKDPNVLAVGLTLTIPPR